MGSGLSGLTFLVGIALLTTESTWAVMLSLHGPAAVTSCHWRVHDHFVFISASLPFLLVLSVFEFLAIKIVASILNAPQTQSTFSTS